jgi:gluconokinase
MGVSGAGKTTVGQLLAAKLTCDFADADAYHSAANVEKMRRRIPLNDADREPWLETLRTVIADWIAARKTAVLACSALKRSYRERLQVGPEVTVVYLKVDPNVLRQRLLRRTGHFMTEAMLDSQLAALEEPTQPPPDSRQDAIPVNGDRPPEEVAAEIAGRLALLRTADQTAEPARRGMIQSN